MKNSKFFLPLLSILLLSVIFNQVIYAASETIPLSPMTTVVRNVELEKDDRLVGSFTIINLQTWKNAFGDTQSYVVSVTVKDPKGQTVLSYTKTTGDSFDYTAFYPGIYTFQFSCGITYNPPSGIENPKATLNYNVVAPSQSETSTSSDLPLFEMIPLFAGIVIATIIAITCFVMERKRE